MGLFINNGKHDDIYKNEGTINEPNQSYYKRDHFEELVKSQLKVNETLQHSVQGLKFLYEKQDNAQTSKWKEIGNRLNELKEMNKQDQDFVASRLRKLEADNSEIKMVMENDRLTEKELVEQVNGLQQSNQEILDQLEVYCLENEEFKSKYDEQNEIQKQLSVQISKQDKTQDEVLSRMENQEALTEKITRQIDYFRSVLFERTNYLAEKIENGYNHTSSYLANLINGSDQTSREFRLEQKKSEEEKVHK